ncbi:hypothetical protein EV127DRAFT_484331 [Xylaria flabelliformis]|nr:hypothetical protein EV127DRAFT_484331 [Xylaria flabelliformis]
MCIRVCIHRTSAAHDKRFHAILHPATGYTVLSPFQDPVIDSCGASPPCIEQPTRGRCPWHGRCCNFDRYDLCNAQPPQSRRCSISSSSVVNYHHFLSKESPTFSVGVLRAYMLDPTFPSLAARFFKAGVELNLALAKLPELKAALDRLGNAGLSGDAAVNKANIASRWYHYQHIKLASAAFMAQLAIYWDMKVDSGLWPSRPGREMFPELNAYNDSDAHLKVVDIGKMDFDPRGEWPHIFKQSPNFGESLLHNKDPNPLPWTLDLESGTWKSVTDISWTHDSANLQLSGTPSATEFVSLTPERRTSESDPEPKQQQHDKDSEQNTDQRPTNRPFSIDSIEPRSPISIPESYLSSNEPPRLPHRRKLDLKRGYRHVRRNSSLSVVSRSNLRRRSYLKSNKQISSEPITPLDSSTDSKICSGNEKGKEVSSSPEKNLMETAESGLEDAEGEIDLDLYMDFWGE